MNEKIFIDLAQRFMSLPTTSFHEHFVAEAVEAFVAVQTLVRSLAEAEVVRAQGT